MAAPAISVVIPLLNEEQNLKPLYAELKAVLQKEAKNHEIIFVDDGSTDGSFGVLKELHKKDGKVKAIKFRKNFGQSAALDAGFGAASGQIIIPMDADMQNDPGDIPRLLAEIRRGSDVVCGWRHERKDALLTKKVPSKMSNWLARRTTGIEIHDFGCTLKAFKSDVVRNFRIYGELHRFLPAIAAWNGFSITEVRVRHRERLFGKSKYGITRLLKGFLDMLNIKFWMQYSGRPLHLFGGIGLVSVATGFLLGLYLSAMKLVFGMSLSDKPLLILAVLLIIIGIQFVIFGFLAEMIVRTSYEQGAKPYSIKTVLK